MKLKSTNVIYLIGIVPLLVFDFGAGLTLAVGFWPRAAVLAAGVACLIWVCRKFRFLPCPETEYADLVPLDFQVPGNFHVQICSSQRMAEFPFLCRIAEVISPFRFRGDEPVKVAVNPKLLREEGKTFMQIAVLRELEKYRQGSQVKTTLGLVCPLLILAGGTEMVILFKSSLGFLSASAVLSVILPMFGAACVVAVLFLWNQNISRQDYRLDYALKAYFTEEEIAGFIMRSEELTNHDEKADRRAMQNYYAEKRLQQLKKRKS